MNARVLRFCERTGKSPKEEETLKSFVKFINYARTYRKEEIDGNPPLWEYEGKKDQEAWDTVLEMVPIEDFIAKTP